MAYFEIHLPDGRVERFELSKASMTIGRSSEADIHIDDPIISRLHGRVDKIHRGRWSITDLDSRNKTYYQDRAIKSHPLTDNDEIYLGSIKAVFHDPSGKSDEDTGQTIYEKVQVERRPAREIACPRCKNTMSEGAVVCTECGYNIKTGKTLKTATEDGNGTTMSPAPKLKKKTEPKPISGMTKPVSKQWLMFRDWWLPTGLVVLGILINFAALPPLKACATLMGMIFSTVLILFSIAIATKLGGIELNHFGNALLKVFAISAVLSMFGALPEVLIFIFSLAVLIGLIKFFFEPRMLEWFLVASLATLLNFFVAHWYIMPQLKKMVEELKG